MDFGAVNVYRTEWSHKGSVEAMEKGDWDSVWFGTTSFHPAVATMNKKR